ncbi:MAG TPA: glycoside hydrolase family 2, partial [Isosphaeraceae bacterium]
GWADPDFDDSSWKRGAPGFGTGNTPAVAVKTRWDSDAIWLRTTLSLPDLKPTDTLALHLFHDEDVEVFVNGQRLYRAAGFLTSYHDLPLDDRQKALFHPGPNVVAVTCRQTAGGQGIDLGLNLVKEE